MANEPCAINPEVTCSPGLLGGLLDLSPRQIQKLAAQGIIPKAAHGNYLLAASIRGYVQFLRRAAHGYTVDDTLAAERHLLTRAKREAAQLEVRRLVADTFDRHEGRRAIATYATATRHQFEAWPSRIVADLAAEFGCDPAALVRALEARVQAFLVEVAAMPMPDLGAAPAPAVPPAA